LVHRTSKLGGKYDIDPAMRLTEAGPA
jgi:hypothetical protein